MGSVGERPSQEKQVTPCGARWVITVKVKGVWSLIDKGRLLRADSAVKCRRGGQGELPGGRGNSVEISGRAGSGQRRLRSHSRCFCPVALTMPREDRTPAICLSLAPPT